MHLVNIWRMVVLVVEHDNGVNTILNLCAGSARALEGPAFSGASTADPFLLSICILHVEEV